MGRPSPATKRKKRQRQKARRKLKFHTESSNISGSLRQQDYSNEYVIGRDLPNEIGEDTDVMHMKLEDFYQQWDDGEYTQGYLLECRQQLIQKVEHYRCQIETLQTEKAELTLKHRKEIEEIRTF
ncbi:MAG: hypothetical protein MJE68_23080, partial [Proteobacteria bacterium]|nr:hypothetical protein [Pseudomonadota bacterium]